MAIACCGLLRLPFFSLCISARISLLALEVDRFRVAVFFAGRFVFAADFFCAIDSPKGRRCRAEP
jgi:hypothetical protein